MGHTPTPWKVFAWKEFEDGERAARHHIQSEAGQLISRCYKRNLSLVESEANAEFIVRAVNSHDELLEAVNATLKYYSALSVIWKENNGSIVGDKGYSIQHDELDRLQRESFAKVQQAIEKLKQKI